VTAPPDFLGPPAFFPKEDIPDWDGISGLRTKALNRGTRDLLGIAD
jgi:hypothetical protein